MTFSAGRWNCSTNERRCHSLTQKIRSIFCCRDGCSKCVRLGWFEAAVMLNEYEQRYAKIVAEPWSGDPALKLEFGITKRGPSV